MRSQNNCILKFIMLIFFLYAASFLSFASDRNQGEVFKSSKSLSAADKSADTDFSGTYRLSDASNCGLIIKIVRIGEEWLYSIEGRGYNSSGRLSFDNSDVGFYFNFTGTLRSGDKTAVTGLYQDETIVIQNYGNSMNQYICFKSCDSKYLVFVKSE